MALMCVGCRTDNRDAAKFCRGCGGRLVALPVRSAEERDALDEAWGVTVQSSLEEDLREDDLTELPVVVPPRASAAPGASRPAPLRTAPSAVQSRPRRIRDTRSHAGVWATFGALLIAAATGGWYAYRANVLKTSSDVDHVAIATSATRAAVPAIAEPAAVSTAPPSGGTSTEVLPPTPPAEAATGQAQAAPPVPTPPRKPRKVAPLPAPAPAAAEVPPPLAPEPPPPVVVAPLPPPPPAPQSACGGRNFIGTAQCMAAQCARAEFATHAQCEPVRRQQRVDEEKRNPLYAN